MSTRATPYEIIIEPLEPVVFPAIRDEAERRGRDARRRDQFILLGHVGAALKEWVTDDAPADAIEQYADLLYHGYHFWSFGRRLLVLDDEVTGLVTEPNMEVDDWSPTPTACYFQFPYQRLWGRVAPHAPFEPVDGFFALVDETEPAPGAGVHVRALLVLGLRPDRPGVSLISYRTDLEPASGVRRATAPQREGGHAFATLIPGGERRDYRTVATTSELEALVLRSLAYVDRHAAAVIPEMGSAKEGETHLPHAIVRAPR